jgi:hypothetical protein
MERNRFVNDMIHNAAREEQAADTNLVNEVRALTDLELMLAAGGEEIVVWAPPK